VAIILPKLRPAFDIVDDDYEAPDGGAWARLGEPEVRERLRRVIRATGRLETPGSDRLQFVGTCMLVRPDLVLIVGNLAAYVRDDEPVRVDFRREVGRAETDRSNLVELIDGPPDSGFCLGRLAAPVDRTPATLGAELPEPSADVAVIGYPDRDLRNDGRIADEIFRHTYGVKRLMPGRVVGSKERRNLGAAVGPTLDHNATTLGGCGGAPVVDLTTGHVVGLQIAGRYLEINHALPASTALAVLDALDSGALSARPLTAAYEGDGVRIVDDTGETPIPSGTDPQRPVLLQDEVAGGWRPILTHPTVDNALRSVAGNLGRLLALDRTGRRDLGHALVARAGEDEVLVAVEAGDALMLNGSGNASPWPLVDFSAAQHRARGSELFRARFQLVHRAFDVGVLAVEVAENSFPSIRFAAGQPRELVNRALALVTLDEAGRVQLRPGVAVRMSGGDVPHLIHDCASDASCRGAPLVDLRSGVVWGVQTSEPGVAEPMWELGRNPEIWSLKLCFELDPRPAWLDREARGVLSTASARRGIRQGSQEYRELFNFLRDCNVRATNIATFAAGAGVNASDVPTGGSDADALDAVMDMTWRYGTLQHFVMAVYERHPAKEQGFKRFLQMWETG